MQRQLLPSLGARATEEPPSSEPERPAQWACSGAKRAGAAGSGRDAGPTLRSTPRRWGPLQGRAPCHLATVTARSVGLGGTGVEAQRSFETLKICMQGRMRQEIRARVGELEPRQIPEQSRRRTMGCREGREGSSSRGFKPGCGDGRRRSGRDGEEEGVRVMGTRRYRQTDRDRHRAPKPRARGKRGRRWPSGRHLSQRLYMPPSPRSLSF